jgi:hypothetical protein
MSTDEYLGNIPGDSDLEAINKSIAWEEAGASEFMKSEPDSNQKNNIVTFRKVSTRPKPLTIVKQGDPQPSGTKNVWSGDMVVEGKVTAVVAYREE